MINILDKSQCCGCTACANACPKNAIKMLEDEKGFKYPYIDKQSCINCNLCEKVCPIINCKKVNNAPKAYACFCKDNEIRKKSSSGGIFTLIATEVINDGGVVFGAGFDDNFVVKHMMVDSIEDLEKLRGSKYVQSDMNKTYIQVKKYLEEDRKVLFSGTPCQNQGLKSYLKKSYENLYTLDIICHGVPSPYVWEKYKQYRKKTDKQEPVKVDFRNKDNGWEAFNLKFEYKGIKSYKKNKYEDLFMKAFLQDVSLRDSCYNCSFKTYNRNTDITLADFWGIKNVIPNIDDDKGISLVIVNSKKGKEMLNRLEKNIIKKEVEINQALKYNPSMLHAVKKNPYREEFFRDLEVENFYKVVKKYCKSRSVVARIKSKVKKVLDIVKQNNN